MVPEWVFEHPDYHLFPVDNFYKFEHIVSILAEDGSGAWIPNDLLNPDSEMKRTMDIVVKKPINMLYHYTDTEKTALYYLLPKYFKEIFHHELCTLFSSFGNSHINCGLARK